MAKCFKERDPRQAIGQASSACMAGVCFFLKLRCFGFYRTRTRTRCCIFEYEKPGKTSIETPKHANSATSKCELGELGVFGSKRNSAWGKSRRIHGRI
jgi:hypothetical protein